MSNDNEKVLKDKNTDAVADYVRGERFQFQNFGAECEIDTFHDYKGKAHYIVNVKSNSRKNHTNNGDVPCRTISQTESII